MRFTSRRTTMTGPKENLRHKTSALWFSLWVGDALGPWEKAALQSFVRHKVGFTLFSYTRNLEVPAGIELRDAGEIVDESQLFRNSDGTGSFAGFSNLFRYSVINSLDAVWFDLDVFLLDPGMICGDYIFGAESLGRLNGAVLGYPAGSEFGTYLLEECQERMQRGYVWGDLGPNLITQAVDKFDLWHWSRPQSTFYSVHFREAWKLFSPRDAAALSTALKDSGALHVWNEVLKSAPDNFPKRHRPPPGSALDNILAPDDLLELPTAPLSDWYRFLIRWQIHSDRKPKKITRYLWRLVSNILRSEWRAHRLAFRAHQRFGLNLLVQRFNLSRRNPRSTIPGKLTRGSNEP